MGNRRRMNSRVTSTVAILATVAAIQACTTTHLCEDSTNRLAVLDERVVKGMGMTLLGPQPIAFGPQRILVDLSIGSRLEMANLSAVWLTYSPPGSTEQRTVPMLPAGDYMDAFCAVVPFNETGLWDVNIKVYRVGGVPATSTFRLLCCEEGTSERMTGKNVEEG